MSPGFFVWVLLVFCFWVIFFLEFLFYLDQNTEPDKKEVITALPFLYTIAVVSPA